MPCLNCDCNYPTQGGSAIPVNVVCGNISGSITSETESVFAIPRCDQTSPTTTVPFYRVVVIEGGAVTGTILVDQSGSPYTIVGTEVDCPSESFSIIPLNDCIPIVQQGSIVGNIAGNILASGGTYNSPADFPVGESQLTLIVATIPDLNDPLQQTSWNIEGVGLVYDDPSPIDFSNYADGTYSVYYRAIYTEGVTAHGDPFQVELEVNVTIVNGEITTVVIPPSYNETYDLCIAQVIGFYDETQTQIAVTEADGTPYVATGTLKLKCEPANFYPFTDEFVDTSFKEIIINCLCDDVVGDLSDIVSYVEAFVQIVDSTNVLTVQSLGTYTDETLTTTYTPVSPVDCDAIGSEITGFQTQRYYLTNQNTWVPTNLRTLSIEIFVVEVGDVSTPPLITNANGVQTPLFVTSAWESYNHGDDHLLRGGFQIDTFSGDKVIVKTTELTTV